MTRLITDRHYLQGLNDLLGIFRADPHEKQKWLKRVTTAYNPTVSVYSSLRRAITRGLEGARLEKLQPAIPEGETPFDKLANKATGEIIRAFDEGMRAVTPGWGNRRASRTIMGHTKVHPASHVSDELNEKPIGIWTNMNNLAQNMFNPIPALEPSGDPVELKLAELESTIRTPSDLFSIPLGSEPGTRRSYGVLHLNDEQKYYLQDEWIKLNNSGAVMKLVKGWNKRGKKAPTPEFQKIQLERILKTNLAIAQGKTKIKFKELREREIYIIKNMTKGLVNPVMPTTGLLNNILPQPQGQ
jgi:hypothetical protein